VVHKRFIDAVAVHLRVLFPRALRDDLSAELLRAVHAPADPDAPAGPWTERGSAPAAGRGSLSLVLSLMAEPTRRAQERRALAAKTAALREALTRLRRAGAACR
jgi:hypothetical protein